MTLHEFLRLPHRFMWGGSGRAHPADSQGRIYNDYTTFCASWVEVVTGIDLARDFRGSYATADDAAIFLADAGGMIALFDCFLLPIGFRRVTAADDGDVAVVRSMAGMGDATREIGAISFGPMWAALAPAGVVSRRAEPVAIWRLAK